MLLETPNLSLAARQANESLVNGDAGAAQAEIVRRLKQMLPESIEAENTLRGWNTPAMAIPTPTNFDVAPAVITGADVGRVLVSMDIETVSQGIGGYQNILHIGVFSIDERARVAQQFLTHWRRAELIRRDLFQFLNGCINAQGLLCWSQLYPGTVRLLPATYSKDFSGVMAQFTAIQAAGDVP